MSNSVIASIGHVALTTADPDAAVESAMSISGLRVARRSGDGVDLTHGAEDHTLQYLEGPTTVLHHVGLAATNAEALAEIGRRASEGGLKIASDRPLDPALSEGLVLEGPGGLLFEIYIEMPSDQEVGYPTTGGVRPVRFGHVTLTVPDPDELRDFLCGTLDFRISDELAGGYFLRCNVDHHGIGVFPGEPGLHHYAWEAAGISDLAAVADRLDEVGSNLILGPVRHGAGSNVAVYFKDGAGALVEYYCEMDRIYNDAEYTPGEWNMEEFKWFSRWAPTFPDGWVELAIGNANLPNT
jgi:catechol 2,3-dioxygenase-like lactoylglutathione lyase family enzyme